jgi:AraC family transcriptional regulator of adaptative response/methylated-DNA-[protein]-cysteine methyltransferase
LQRVFSEWVGISPKRFLQYLTKTYALNQLQHSATVFDTVFNAGLSAPSRLHDLLVTCEAMTPAEIRNQGAGLQISYGCGNTPFGQAVIGWTTRGMCYFAFEDDLHMIAQHWLNATFQRDDAQAQAWCKQIFAQSVSEPTQQTQQTRLHLLLKGTNFQIKVWEALLRTQAGQLVSYGQLAQQAGSPQAARAVGSAMANNLLAYFIPCHRVIRETGEFNQYRWGIERKLALIGWEAVQVEVQAEVQAEAQTQSINQH